MASETTKYQINFKTHKDGTLVNIYADSIKELETQITDIAMIAALIKSTESELWTLPQGASVPTVQSIAQAFNSPGIVNNAAAAPAVQAAGGNACRHGAMAFREGTSAKGPWKGYMCAAPKGAPDKCDTIWVR
jgi:hypothetical protein